MGEAIGSMEELVENIHSFFVNLSSDFQPLEDDSSYQAECPPDMLVDPYQAYYALKEVKCHKSVGPDEIPNRILRDFAFELSPVVSDIYNSTLRQGKIPELLKSSIVSPIPKCMPPKSIEDDLRPISLTPQIAKIMEGFTLESFLADIGDQIDPYQFAMKGRSTTQALVFLLHNVLGSILFAVLVNSLLRDWNFRVKFVDDLTTIECIPRCSLSMTPLLVNDVYDYALTRGMRLNLKK